MNSIDAMQREIQSQLAYLNNVNSMKPEDNCLMVGAGDSYAAALAAQYASANCAISCHPMDVVLNPQMADNRKVYFVSASGNTTANLLAARSAQRRGSRTVAVTANAASRLARACDGIIHLKYETAGVPTAGTISFVANLFACLSLAGQSRIPANLQEIYEHSDAQAEKVASEIASMRGTYVILADGGLFPAALYGTLKFHEVTGSKAVAYPAEEFCHSPVFSLSRKDTVIIMGSGRDQSRRLDKRLNKEGFSSVYVEFARKGFVELLLHSTFFIQLLVLRISRIRKIKEPYFLRNRRLLKLSSDFIYG